MKVFMMAMGICYLIIGFSCHDDPSIIMGNVWLVGSLIYGKKS